MPSVISQIRNVLDAQSNSFEQYLHESGWRDWFDEAFAQQYQFRTKPEAFLVDESFPAITPELIRDAVANGDLVESVTYKVDVAGLSPVPGLIEIDHLAWDR